MEAVPPELLLGPFLVRDALARGVGRQMLRGRRFRTPWAGVRVPAHLPDDLRTRCAALALLLPDAVFSHATAAELMHLWLPPGWNGSALHVSRAVDAASRRAGVVAHRTTWKPGDLRERWGLRITSPGRTLCDLAAANWTLTDLVAAADCIQSRRLATEAELRARIEACVHTPGAQVVREAARLTRPGVDSAMETRMRLQFRAAGLPEPVVNGVVEDADGEYVHRPDLSWPEYRVAADYDGAHHLTDAERRRRIDIARAEAMREEGWLLVLLTATDVLQHPGRAAARVRRALGERGLAAARVLSSAAG